MPITIKPHTHPSMPFPQPSPLTSKSILKNASPSDFKLLRNDNLIQSSFSLTSNPQIQASNNGLIHSILSCYDQHRHLRIRPDEVWFTILTQLNIYINAHSDELRHLFVSHSGQKHLVLDVNEFRNKHGEEDWGLFAFTMTKLLAENLKDETLKGWILPNFTTTTKKDQAVASIIMMSVLQKYFTYGADEICGIPTVTLLGVKSDWEKLLGRIERIGTFGEEAKEWVSVLRPVLERFVRSFEESGEKMIRQFWRDVVRQDDSMCGVDLITGWLTAFCFWDSDAKPFRSQPGAFPTSPIPGQNPGPLILDGIKYHRIDRSDLPSAHCSVPITMTGFGVPNARMVAGVIAIKTSFSESSASTSLSPFPDIVPDFLNGILGKPPGLMVNRGEDEEGEGEGEGGEGKKKGGEEMNTLQPESGWWIFEEMSKEEVEAEEEEKKRKEEEYWKEWNRKFEEDCERWRRVREERDENERREKREKEEEEEEKQGEEDTSST